MDVLSDQSTLASLGFEDLIGPMRQTSCSGLPGNILPDLMIPCLKNVSSGEQNSGASAEPSGVRPAPGVCCSSITMMPTTADSPARKLGLTSKHGRELRVGRRIGVRSGCHLTLGDLDERCFAWWS
jgi:hypothetical protein